jgi:DNA-binding CsgD family transcriptional regulator
MHHSLMTALVPNYSGPERRAAPHPVSRWVTMMLDEVPYGMILLADDAEVVHVNFTAREELDAGHPLQLLGRQLRARHPQDVARLHDALANASKRGIRKLVALGEGRARGNLAVIPLGAGSTLVSLGKRHLSERLTVQMFANQNHLTSAETRVLEALCEGHEPAEVAELNEVKLATVRTQIGSIRAKTGTGNIRDLVRLVAMLPPIVQALRA